MTDFTTLPQDQWHRVTTRDGRKVRILCVDGPEYWPVVCVIPGEAYPRCFTATGKHSDCRDDIALVLPPEPRTVWLRDYGGCCVESAMARGHLWGGKDFTDYRITLAGGQPPRIEEVK